MSRKPGLRAAGTMLLGLMSAACDGSTAPSITESLDTDAAIEDFQALENVFASEDWAAFQALGGRTPFGAAGASIEVAGALAGAATRDGGLSLTSTLVDRVVAAHADFDEAPALGPIISGWHRGSTFVYDPSTDEYEPDLTREGAPATGVRFIVYAVDPAGVPIIAEERGYADLIDEGDGSAEDIALRLRVVMGDETVLDYLTTLDHDATSGALSVGGFLAGDGARLDFDIRAAAREADGVTLLDVDFDLAVEARGFSITGAVRGIEDGAEDDGGSVDITVRHRSDSLRVDMTGADGLLDGSVYLNDRLFATVQGPEDDLVFLGADGHPLRPGEILVLHRIVDVIEDAFDFLEDLIDPVDEIVLLGVIL